MRNQLCSLKDCFKVYKYRFYKIQTKSNATSPCTAPSLPDFCISLHLSPKVPSSAFLLLWHAPHQPAETAHCPPALCERWPSLPGDLEIRNTASGTLHLRKKTPRNGFFLLTEGSLLFKAEAGQFALAWFWNWAVQLLLPVNATKNHCEAKL